MHDGVYGSPEVDYQQDHRLDVHWEGFFDHESGVAFYHYDFAEVCLRGEHFQNKSLVSILETIKYLKNIFLYDFNTTFFNSYFEGIGSNLCDIAITLDMLNIEDKHIHF